MSFNGVDTERLMRLALEGELMLIGNEITEKVVEYLKANGHTVNGDLWKSIAPIVTQEMESVRLTVAAGAEHAIFVHEGTKPHWAPIEPLRRYVKKKYRLSSARKKVDVAFTTKDGRQVSFKARVSPLEQRARALQAYIARHGTRPHPFMTIPFALFKDKIAGRIARRIEAQFGS